MIQFTQIAFQLANKKFFRSPQWEQNLVIRIFIIIIIFICLASFFTFGLGLFWILKKRLSGSRPGIGYQSMVGVLFFCRIVDAVFSSKSSGCRHTTSIASPHLQKKDRSVDVTAIGVFNQ